MMYVSEYLKGYKKFSAKSGMLLLDTASFPADILRLGAENINQIWSAHKLRAIGMQRATPLVKATQCNIGLAVGPVRLELHFRARQAQLTVLKQVKDTQSHDKRFKEEAVLFSEEIKIRKAAAQLAIPYYTRTGACRVAAHSKILQKALVFFAKRRKK